MFAGGGLRYIDALFFSVGSATQSGLNTIDVNLLQTYQQVGICFLAVITNPIFIHTSFVFIRLHWFEKRFRSVVREANLRRGSKSRSRTAVAEPVEQDYNREEMGIRGRTIVVLRNDDTGQTAALVPQEIEKPNAQSNADDSNSTSPNGRASEGQDRLASENHDGGLHAPRLSATSPGSAESRLPFQVSDEHHITLLENQRRYTGALRIPSPREYDRGGVPQALDIVDGGELGKTVTSQSEQSPDSQIPDLIAAKLAFPPAGQHITIDDSAILRSRAKTTALPNLDSRRAVTRGTDIDGSTTEKRTRSRRGTFSMFFPPVTQKPERDAISYLSWQPTIGRNSAFVDLTEEQREELGGVEYRALKALAVILIGYYLIFSILGVACFLPWIMREDRYGNVVRDAGIGRPWWGIFTLLSAFNNVGFTLTPDSMLSFFDAIFPLLVMTFLIIIGNTGFPCMLRFIIWLFSKIVPPGSAVWEELRFLLDHPRRCFTLLFPRRPTWWLFAILVILNGVDLIFFIVLDVSDCLV
jgi:hypothetical protein